jgi:seryl-tRNA synthetase
MHDIRWIREHPDEFDRGLKRRGLEPESSALLALDEARRAAITRFETAQARRNAASKEIGEAKKAKDEARAQALLAEVGELKTAMADLETQAKKASDTLDAALAQIPNLPLAEVPDGTSADDNVEHHRFGAVKNYAFAPQQHFDLGEALGQMDFETAAKLSGARFVVLKSGLARLDRAIGQFMLDLHTREHGYTEVAPPLLVRDDVMYGTAQLPKFADDQFRTDVLTDEQIASLAADVGKNYVQDKLKEYLHGREEELSAFSRQQDFGTVEELVMSFLNIEKAKVRKEASEIMRRELEKLIGDNRRWLIPTAEVPLTNLVREQILDEDSLPLRFTALTPCFRAEAGAAGKDTRGMLRQHQFDKVELVSITTPETSRDEHERTLACAEEVLRRLDLHYRVVTLCTGDMGFASQKTYDIEVWLPGQGAYREISSCSVCGDFQARRMAARYRAKADRTVRHVHTLNGSGVAVGRALIAVMETYQDQGGGIAVPDVLQPYMGGTKRIEGAAKNR